MILTANTVAKLLDHSTLQPFLTQEDIRKGCELALKYTTATVCARPQDMPLVSSMLKGSGILPCTVIGFPHGSHTMESKLFEVKQALKDGCEELDMVINIGRMLAGEYDYVEKEIKMLADASHDGGAILKVIIETCFLSDEQKVKACQLSEAAGADFVKTSTGYGTAGAKIEDVRLMRKTVSEHVRVKASGGIRNLDTVLSAYAAGAARCGVSATEAIMVEAIKREAEGTLILPETLTEMSGGY